MPAPPEIGDVRRPVWRVEVLGQAEAEQVAQANCHVAVAGKVEVQLIGIAQQAQPRADRGQLRVPREGRIDDGRDRIREEDLLDHADHEKRPADISVGRPVGTVDALDILLDLPEANDGAGDELGKQRDVRREFEEVARRRNHAPVPIDHIGDRMERVERDADREHDIEKRQHRVAAEPGRDLVEISDHEVGVLEESQQREICRDRKHHAQLPAPRILPPEQPKAGQVADRGGKEHQRAKLVVPERVEGVAADRQPHVPRRLSRQMPEHEVGDRKEGEEKPEAVEQHYFSPTPLAGPP